MNSRQKFTLTLFLATVIYLANAVNPPTAANAKCSTCACGNPVQCALDFGGANLK